MPGSPLDPRAEGTNDLIRDGATFCTSAEDVIRALGDRGPGRGSDDLFSDAGPRDGSPMLWDELDLDCSEPERGQSEPLPNDRFAFRETEEIAQPPAARRSGVSLARVVEQLGPAPVSIDELARSTELPIGDVRGVVLELEIAGRIERHGGGLVSLIMP